MTRNEVIAGHRGLMCKASRVDREGIGSLTQHGKLVAAKTLSKVSNVGHVDCLSNHVSVTLESIGVQSIAQFAS